MEARLRAFGFPYLFVDLRSLPDEHPLRAPHVGHALGHGPIRAPWPEFVDALFVIGEMFPSTADGAVPDSHPGRTRMRAARDARA